MNDEKRSQQQIDALIERLRERAERPGSYRWEALSDYGATDLIGRIRDYLDLDAFREVADLQAQAESDVEYPLRQ